MKLNSRIVISLFLMFVIPVSTTSNYPEIMVRPVNFGMQKAIQRSIDVIVIHSTYNASGGNQYDIKKIIKQFAAYNVSSHYLIDRDGTIIQLVKEQHIAYHAGKSKLPDGSRNINSRSIGIEIINSKHDVPTEMQIQSAVKLTQAIQQRYSIKYLLRHSDIAPSRKTDPWNMDWTHFINLTKEGL